MAPASEKVDERILRLLGLDFVGDIDYGTYITLLNEAILSGRNRLPQEELALLSNEKKRIKGKQGRFKPQKQKITADKFATTKFLKPVVQPISSPLLPPQVQAPPTPPPVNLTPLQGPLESIRNTLDAFLKFRKGADEQERKAYEAQTRAKREAVLENAQRGMAAVSNTVKTFISPFQSIIDRIFNFIFFTLLGRAFNQLIGWFSDPKNTQKVQVLQRFLKDWWPTLLGAAVLFLTPFGRFVRGVLRIVGGLTGKLIGQIPKLVGAIGSLRLVLARNPLLATIAVGAAAVGGVAATVSYFNREQSKEPEDQGVANAEQQVQQFSSGGSVLRSLFGFNNVNPYAQLFGYGGITNDTGQRISGFGPDTQLIAAQPGEIVINKKTVEAVGSDTFLTLNRYYGGPGANQPKLGRLFNTGGEVGGQSSLLNSRALHIINRLRSKGLSPTAAMGIVANIGVETGYTYSPSTTQQGGGPGRGIVQWESGGRFDTDRINLQEFARSRNKSWNDLNTQVDFIVHELDNHPEFKPLKFALNNAKNTQEATQLFLTKYEKAGVSHFDRRLAVGQELEKKLKSPATAKTKPKDKKEEGKRHWYDPCGWFGGAAAKRKKGGGVFDVTSKTGFEIPKSMFPGVDTQFVPLALQPGEKGFIIPKEAVGKGAVPEIEKLIANLAPDSNSAKELKYQSDPKLPEIKPLSKGKGGVSYLPDITQSIGGSSGSAQGGGSQVPMFSAICPKNERGLQAELYGIGSM